MLYRFVYYFLAPWVIGPFLRLFNRLSLIGFDRIPEKGPAVIIANHLSLWDAIYVYWFVRRPMYFMAKAELFSIPVLGYLLRRIRVFPVKRDAVDRAALRMAAKVLEEGNMLVIFPEGTRSKDGELSPFKDGAALFAYRAHAPIVPLVMHNTMNTFPHTLGSKIKIMCGQPFRLESESTGESSSAMIKGMTSVLQNEIYRLQDEVRCLP